MSALDEFQPQELIECLYGICEQAGSAIMRVYHQHSIDVSAKSDNSPVTEADIASHSQCLKALTALTPNVPIISEEDDHPNPGSRTHWSECWMLDPLDGTAEFLDRTDEFTINLAFIRGTEAILGVVYHPPSGQCYIGGSWLEGAWRYEEQQLTPLGITPMSARIKGNQPLRLLGSRRHGLQHWDSMIETLENQLLPVEHIRCGSALKFCRLAEGNADLYVRFGPTSEWDTAAGQAILEAAGGQVVTHNFDELRYNAKASIINPEFFAYADGGFDWRPFLLGSLANAQRE